MEYERGNIIDDAICSLSSKGYCSSSIARVINKTVSYVNFRKNILGIRNIRDQTNIRAIKFIYWGKQDTRITNSLYGANIETIDDLLEKSAEDLLKYRGFGKESINAISSKLKDMNLSLKDDVGVVT